MLVIHDGERACAAVAGPARARTYGDEVTTDDDAFAAVAARVRDLSEKVRATAEARDAALRARADELVRARDVIGARWAELARAVGTDPDGHLWCTPDSLRKITSRATED